VNRMSMINTVICFSSKMAKLLKDLHGDAAKFYDAIANWYPERVAVAKKWGKRRPHVTAGAYTVMDKERGNLDKMDVAGTAAGGKLTPPEHDGGPFKDVTCEVKNAIHASVPVPVKVKPYPQNFAQFLETAKKRYPHEDWTVRSRFDWSDVHRALVTTRKQIVDYTKKGR